MRDLEQKEMLHVAGGAIGDVDQYIFSLYPDEQVYGVQLTVIGYEKYTWVEKGIFFDSIESGYQPIFDVQPMIAVQPVYYY